MDWADQTGVSYLAWGWFAGVTPDCSDGGYYLLTEAGAPASPNGVAVRDHLLALAESSSTMTGTGTNTSPSPNPNPGGSSPAGGSVGGSRSVTRTCVVPRLAGESLARATRRLKAAHCRLGKVTRPRSRAGLVVASSTPRAARHERNGTRVALRMRAKRPRARSGHA
jgi:hypothetical protein